MARTLKLTAALSLIGMVILAVLYRKTACGVLLPLAITLGTVFYHVGMRLSVGLAFHLMMKNKADLGKRWYHVGERETAAYEKLRPMTVRCSTRGRIPGTRSHRLCVRRSLCMKRSPC